MKVKKNMSLGCHQLVHEHIAGLLSGIYFHFSRKYCSEVLAAQNRACSPIKLLIVLLQGNGFFHIVSLHLNNYCGPDIPTNYDINRPPFLFQLKFDDSL